MSHVGVERGPRAQTLLYPRQGFGVIRGRTLRPGSVLESIAGPGAPSNELLVGALVVTTAVWGVLSLLAFVRSERRAKDLGLLDRTSAY